MLVGFDDLLARVVPSGLVRSRWNTFQLLIQERGIQAKCRRVLLDKATGKDAARQLTKVVLLHRLEHSGANFRSLRKLLKFEALLQALAAQCLANGSHECGEGFPASLSL